MTKSKLGTGLVTEAAKKPIELKNTDYAINKFQSDFSKGQKTIRTKISNSGIKGLKISQNITTKRKYFIQQFWFDGKSDHWTVGEFRLGIFGVKDCKTKVVNIMDTHTHDNGLWKKNPKVALKHSKERTTKAELADRTMLTVNECIERLCKANLPKIKKHGTLTATSQQRLLLPLIGYNKRTKHLLCEDDSYGNGSITFKACKQYNTVQPTNWDDLFAKFPSGHGCINFINGKTMVGTSIYDHNFGKYLIEELTPGTINTFLDEVPRGWATKRNMIVALQVLWANSKKYMGPDRPVNPTTREALDAKKFDVSKGINSKYNRQKFNLTEMQMIWDSLVKISWKHPFQAECLMLMLVSGRRNRECLKITKSMVYPKGKKDNPFGMDNIILMPGKMTKNRVDSFITITPAVQVVLDQLDKQYLKPALMKYKFIPWMFPTTKSAAKAWLDKEGNLKREYVHSKKTRLTDIRECWKTMMDDTGLRNKVPRMLRKSYASEAVRSLKTSAKAKNLTGHVKAATLDIHYDVHNQDQVRDYAHQVAESFGFTKDRKDH